VLQEVHGLLAVGREPAHALRSHVTQAIRAVDPTTLVWYAPMVTFNFGIRTTHGDVQDARAGFGFNTYCQYTTSNWPLGVLTWYHLGWTCAQLADRVLDLAEAQAAKYDDSVLMTEWGATDDLRELESNAELAEQHMMSWQQWAYWTEEPSNANGKPHDSILRTIGEAPTGDNVKWQRVAVSARVRPDAIAGTPTSWSFKPTPKRFDLAYSTLLPGQTVARFPEGSETTIEVPVAHYPGDYAVSVSGGRVTSEPGARHVSLASCPGATNVKVTILPGTTPPSSRVC
jgi:endoglycosylceramidase